ncbi:MAG: guanylate kinase [Planctomycetota bacterium]|nr:guanylate kinase [Planctomycetota bacterium]
MVVVISGPSGVGKTSVVKRLLEDKRFVLSVSATTRAPRRGERNGVDYYFVSEDEFKRMVERGELLEWAVVFGHHYGTPKSELERASDESKILILDVDVQGVEQLRAKNLEGVYIQIRPPDEEELRRRLKGRKTESETELQMRLKKAAYELSRKELFDHFVVNDILDKAVARIKNIIENAFKEKKNGPCKGSLKNRKTE